MSVRFIPLNIFNNYIYILYSVNLHVPRNGCTLSLVILTALVTSSSSAPVARNLSSAYVAGDLALSAHVARDLASSVSTDTTGLELPTDLVAGIGDGSGAFQLVVNVHTDSRGNIEVYTN
ncbi:hypothetical protein O0L34_g3773 [Tuta absoluta]|nr:hypothetical protein O0L34_g3773 [Tuta absoluta]